MLERPAKRAKLEKLSPDAVIDSPRNHTRKTATKDVDKTALPERRSRLWKVGAHVSSAGGVENAVMNAARIGANAFAIFLKSQRRWSSPALTTSSISTFKERMQDYGYSNSVVLPHGSYLINLGNPDAEKRQKSYDCFLDDLMRCEQLGLELYNFHPGSTVGGTTTANSISLIAECINRAHKATSYVTTLLENMAGAGNIIGSDFTHLADIIEEVEDKTRVGVCLDTCHMFAAGYDIRTKDGWNATLEKFDTQVGLSYLRGMHLNDSKMELNSKRDRHENIGIGYLGLPAFHHILTDPRMQRIPLVIETPTFELPDTVWKTEIDVLNRLSGMEEEDEENGKQEGGVLQEMMKTVRSTVQVAKKASEKKVKSGARRGKSKKDRVDVENEDSEC